MFETNPHKHVPRMLHVDYRERELMACLEKRGVEYTHGSMEVGDILLGQISDHKEEEKEAKEAKDGVKGYLVIERKSMVDFEASILDGRYREQRGRLLAYCQQTPGAQPVYLLEGSWRAATGRLAPSALLKLINRLQLRYQIPVIRTASVEESAEWIHLTLDQWREDPTALQRTTELVKVSDGLHVQKKANAAQPEQFLKGCLMQCTGISAAIAERLAEVFPTFDALLGATVAEIQNVQVGKKKLGPAVAGRLHGLLHGGRAPTE